MKQELQSIEFYGSRIYTVEKDGEHYVAMKPICEGIGIDWEGQRQRIMRHPVLKSTACMIKAVAEDGKKRELLMLPIEMLHGWLFLIDSNKVNANARSLPEQKTGG
jgi:P22_AR N-terminal domain